MEKIEKNGGFLSYLPSEIDGEAMELSQIFVDKGLREKGLGSEMFSELIEISKSKGLKKIITFSSTNPDTEVFGKFLVASGFIKLNEANNVGDKWVLDIDKKEISKEEIKNEEIKTPRKRGRPKNA